LVPLILGDAVDLPPIVVIIGVIVGGTVAGILGVFLSTPVIATGREIFGYLYDKILEPPPPETPPEEKPSITDMIRGWVKKINLPLSRKKQVASK
jgi:predicted PurR-regulated permease PerM